MLPVSATLLFVYLEILIPKGGVFSPGETIMTAMMEVETITWPLWDPPASEPTDKKVVSILAGMNDHDQ